MVVGCGDEGDERGKGGDASIALISATESKTDRERGEERGGERRKKREGRGVHHSSNKQQE